MCSLNVSQVVCSRLGKHSSDVKTMGCGFQLADYFCHLWMFKSARVLSVRSLWEGPSYRRPVRRRGQGVLSSEFVICENSSLLLRRCNRPLQKAGLELCGWGRLKPCFEGLSLAGVTRGSPAAPRAPAAAHVSERKARRNRAEQKKRI